MIAWEKVFHFSRDEFSSPDAMAPEFVYFLDRVRGRAGVPIRITSTVRSREHNAAVGGALDSSHMDIPCNAADVEPVPTVDDPHGNTARWKIVFAAYEEGCKRVGIYSNGSIHLDLTGESHGGHRPEPSLWVKVDNPAG